MFREDLESREAEIINTISLLPKGFIVIGGYAASALSAHRFSVDCDIVISKEDAKEFRNELRKQNYKKLKSAKGFDEAYGGAVEIYTKRTKTGTISVDLFINSITARKTMSTWGYEYVKDNSNEATISGVRNSANVSVPTKELLMAMKIHSGRDMDIRDIVMLSEDADWKSVTEHAARGEKNELVKHLTHIMSRMDEKQFGESLRAAFGLRKDMEPLITSCKKNLTKLRETIESTKR